jgi:hypothetical protein
MRKALNIRKISRLFGRETKISPQWKILKNNPPGAVIVVIVVTMTIVAILGAGMLSLISSSSFSELFINNRHKAFYLAQSGRNYATMTILNAYRTGDMSIITALDGKTFTLDGNEFYLSTTIRGAGLTDVESAGIVNKGTVMETKQKIAFTVRDPTVVEGAASVGAIWLYGGAIVDGYDSTGGHIYDPLVDRPLNSGILQTNSTTSVSKIVVNTGKLFGKAFCGVGCDPSPAGGVIVQYAKGFIYGVPPRNAATKNYDPTPQCLPTCNKCVPVIDPSAKDPNCPYIDPPDCTACDITIPVTLAASSPPVTLREGKYVAKDPTNIADPDAIVMNGSFFYVSGIVTLIVKNNLTMYRTSKIIINPGGILVLWIKNSLSVGGTSEINYQGQPPNMVIKGVYLTTLDFVKDSKIYTTVYAPGSAFSVDGTSQIWGSVYAQTIYLNNGAQLHCDVALSKGKDKNVGY